MTLALLRTRAWMGRAGTEAANPRVRRPHFDQDERAVLGNAEAGQATAGSEIDESDVSSGRDDNPADRNSLLIPQTNGGRGLHGPGPWLGGMGSGLRPGERGSSLVQPARGHLGTQWPRPVARLAPRGRLSLRGTRRRGRRDRLGGPGASWGSGCRGRGTGSSLPSSQEPGSQPRPCIPLPPAPHKLLFL